MNTENKKRIRKRIFEEIRLLNEEDRIDINEIAAELIHTAYLLVSDKNCILEGRVESLFKVVEIIEENNEEIDDEIEKEFEAEYQKELLKDKFRKSKIDKRIRSLIYEHQRSLKLEKYLEAYEIADELINLFSEHLRENIKTFGKPTDYVIYYRKFKDLIYPLMQQYLVLLDEEKLKNLVTVAKEYRDLIGSENIDIELIEMKIKKCIQEIPDMQKIYNFLKMNPGYKQSVIFRKLSIFGRKTSISFEIAEKLRKISRVRHNSTWSLKYLD